MSNKRYLAISLGESVFATQKSTLRLDGPSLSKRSWLVTMAIKIVTHELFFVVGFALAVCFIP